MKLLLDTCSFLWLAGDPSKISASAAAAINDPTNAVFLSDVSLLEIVLKHSAGKLSLPDSPRIWVAQQIVFFRIASVAISQEVILRSGELPRAHVDPFDRLIAAEVLCNGFDLVTPDPAFAHFGVVTLW